MMYIRASKWEAVGAWAQLLLRGRVGDNFRGPKPDRGPLGGVASSSTGHAMAAPSAQGRLQPPQIATSHFGSALRQCPAGGSGPWPPGAGPDPSEGPAAFGCESTALPLQTRPPPHLRSRPAAD